METWRAAVETVPVSAVAWLHADRGCNGGAASPEQLGVQAYTQGLTRVRYAAGGPGPRSKPVISRTRDVPDGAQLYDGRRKEHAMTASHSRPVPSTAVALASRLRTG